MCATEQFNLWGSRKHSKEKMCSLDTVNSWVQGKSWRRTEAKGRGPSAKTRALRP